MEVGRDIREETSLLQEGVNLKTASNIQEKQATIDKYFLSEQEKQERAVYERILSYGGDLRLNRKNLEADSKAVFGIEFATLDCILRSLKTKGIPGILPPNVLLKTSVSQRPAGWKTYRDTQVFLKIWVSNSFKKIQKPELENLLVV